MDNAISVDLSGMKWEQIGERNPSDRLLGCLTILGVEHHLEAWAVKRGKEVVQTTSDPAAAEDLDRLFFVFAESESAFCTVKINRREYVLFMSPYC